MITENDVVLSVCNYLEKNGYIIEQSLNTDEKGYDIIASKDDRRLIIEAKGSTSSKPNTSRYGKEFTRNQVKTHVSVALFAAAKLYNKDTDCEIGIALPKNDAHIEMIGLIKRTLVDLKIKIYWVDYNGYVSER